MAWQWLQDVPKEIRIMVYEEYFRTLEVNIHTPVLHIPNMPPCGKNHSRVGPPGLLLVAKHVNREARSIFLKEATFYLFACPCIVCDWWGYWQTPPELSQMKHLILGLNVLPQPVDYLLAPGNYLKSICLQPQRKYDYLGVLSDKHEEKRSIKFYSRQSQRFEYFLVFRVYPDLPRRYFEAQAIIEIDIEVTLDYITNDWVDVVATSLKSETYVSPNGLQILYGHEKGCGLQKNDSQARRGTVYS